MGAKHSVQSINGDGDDLNDSKNKSIAEVISLPNSPTTPNQFVDYFLEVDKKLMLLSPEKLPPKLIGKILSFLPIKEAVATSILSKRWRHLWANSTHLSFCDPLTTILDGESFYSFVDRVLFQGCTPERVCLSTSRVGFSRVKAWIDEAINGDVRELELRLPKFPCNVFTCETLLVLKLYPAVNQPVYEIPNSFNLPSLKILSVVVPTPSNDLTSKLFCSCPNLEDLKIVAVGVVRDSSFVVSGPVL